MFIVVCEMGVLCVGFIFITITTYYYLLLHVLYGDGVGEDEKRKIRCM